MLVSKTITMSEVSVKPEIMNFEGECYDVLSRTESRG